jgi:hypothetical protein
VTTPLTHRSTHPHPQARTQPQNHLPQHGRVLRSKHVRVMEHVRCIQQTHQWNVVAAAATAGSADQQRKRKKRKCVCDVCDHSTRQSHALAHTPPPLACSRTHYPSWPIRKAQPRLTRRCNIAADTSVCRRTKIQTSGTWGCGDVCTSTKKVLCCRVRARARSLSFKCVADGEMHRARSQTTEADRPRTPPRRVWWRRCVRGSESESDENRVRE